MPSVRRLVVATSLLLCWLPLGLLAKPLSFGAASHVQASLVAADASVQPGHPLTVALRLVHDEHWHTYWLNPGTGLATSLKWHLPAGWKASEIEWPAPHLLRDHTGTIVGNGYDGDQLLPITLTPPADVPVGSTVKLEADADWLMCSDVCVPGGSPVALTLPVAAGAPTPDPTWGAKIRAVVDGLPRALPEWHVTATRQGKQVTLAVAPAKPGQSARAPRDVHFFSEDGLIAFDAPQTVQPDATTGGFTLRSSVPPEAPADAARVVGVLTSENGWAADGSLRGLRVDVPLTVGRGPAAAAAAAPQVPAAASRTGDAAAPAPSLAGTLIFGLLGGLILNLMPCVFPVIGLKIMGFVNQAGHERRRVAMHGLTFTAGVLLSFWTLAAVLTILRAGGSHLGWGFQLQSAAFVYGLAVLFLVFAMNMSGVFEVGLRATSIGSELQTRSGYAGSFFSGILATLAATPCSAPLVGPVLGVALAVPPVESFAIFTSIAVGLSLPYLLLSIFPQAVKLLPRPGGWMETFKHVMAFPLYATVGYLAWVLAGQLDDIGLRNALLSFAVIALGLWMYGHWNAPGASSARARLGFASLVLVGAAGLWFGWPKNLEPAPKAANAAPDVVWEPWSPEAVAKLHAEGRIVYVDFTARWCATCQTNKALVFHNDEVLRYFADHHIATLRADWTKSDPRITAALASYGRSAVPFNLVFLPGKDEPIILPSLLTPSIVLDALKG